MAERKCLMTFYPTKCKDNCFNCKCGGEEATKDMCVSIHNVQRVCALTGGAADTDEGEYIAEVIRNNLENMVIEAQPVKYGRWESPVSVGNGIKFCSVCRNEAYWDTDYGQQLFDYCPYCGADMRGDTDDKP